MPDRFRFYSFYGESGEKFYLHSEFEVYMIDRKQKLKVQMPVQWVHKLDGYHE